MNDELVLIENKIYEIRGSKVMLDFDLAELYGIETKALKQAVKRNIERFPDDFMYRLTNSECNSLIDSIRSQNVTLEVNWFRYAPYAFTEISLKLQLNQSNPGRIAVKGFRNKEER